MKQGARCALAAAETTPRKVRPMPAKYRGRCAACNGHINVGTPIIYDHESRKATHARCV